MRTQPPDAGSDRRQRRVSARARRGGVMLLCMLAAVVIAGAVLGLAQSHRHRIMRIDARRVSVQSTQLSSGLYQRALAVIRNNNAFSGRIDPVINSPVGSYALIQQVSKSETVVSVFAYAKAAVPVIATTIDPASLGASSNDSVSNTAIK